MLYEKETKRKKVSSHELKKYLLGLTFCVEHFFEHFYRAFFSNLFLVPSKNNIGEKNFYLCFELFKNNLSKKFMRVSLCLKWRKWVFGRKQKKKVYLWNFFKKLFIKGITLNWTNFKWSNFKWSNFKWSNFKCTNFKWINFKWINFKWTNFKWNWIFSYGITPNWIISISK